MWIKVAYVFFLFISLYLIVLLVIKLIRGNDFKETKPESKTDIKANESRVIKGVVVKAVKKRNDDLVNITKRYNLAINKTLPDNSNNEEPENENSADNTIEEQDVEFKIEATISDDSIVTELEDANDTETIEKMIDIMKNISSNAANKTSNNEDDFDYSDYEQGIDDSYMSDFINTDFLKEIEEKE